MEICTNKSNKNSIKPLIIFFRFFIFNQDSFFDFTFAEATSDKETEDQISSFYIKPWVIKNKHILGTCFLALGAPLIATISYYNLPFVFESYSPPTGLNDAPSASLENKSRRFSPCETTSQQVKGPFMSSVLWGVAAITAGLLYTYFGWGNLFRGIGPAIGPAIEPPSVSSPQNSSPILAEATAQQDLPPTSRAGQHPFSLSRFRVQIYYGISADSVTSETDPVGPTAPSSGRSDPCSP